MILLSDAQEIEIEREFISAILDSACRAPGSARRIAQHAQISTVHFSYIRRGKRLPRLHTARDIGNALPFSRERQEEWVCHVEQVWALKRRVRKRFLRLARDSPVDHLVREIKRLHQAALSPKQPRIAKANYRSVKILAEHLIDYIQPNVDPLNYLELSFLLHDTLCVLDRNDQALWYGKRAHWLADSIDDPGMFHTTAAQMDYFRVKAMRAEAVALLNLHLSRAAQELCEHLIGTDAFQRSEQFWKPQLYPILIDAIQERPRFSVTQVENLADEARTICDGSTEPQAQLLSLLVATSLARAYIAHKNFKDAFRILSPWQAHLNTIPGIGPLDTTGYFRTWGLFYSRRGDYGAEWRHFTSRAAHIAISCGLEYQLDELYHDAGAHAEEIMPARSNVL